MNTDFTLPLACLLAIPAVATAGDGPLWSIGVEAGPVWQSKNDVQIPGDTGTRFALNEITGSGPFPFARLELTYHLTEKQELRGLLAPLSLDGVGTLTQPINFNGVTFTPGATEAKYKFNSYRLTWRYTMFDSSAWTWKLGITGKIRDASIELRQGGVSTTDSNVGLVPLVNLYGEYRLAGHWRGILDFDGLVGPSGRAFDCGLKAAYELTPQWSLEAGYRVLEGGADNDKVYNFALFNYAVLGARYRF